ncbi:MAG: IgGFc-binding protein, partial [Polyangiaceae bacterium]
TLGGLRCAPELERCAQGQSGAEWQLLDDCTSRGLICSRTLEACTVCEPNQGSCSGQTKMLCDESGNSLTPGDTCDPSTRQVCREGSCVNLCSEASQRRSNVGCEYFAVDLDNAVISEALNAAAQQFAVVISNPQTDVTSDVTIEQDDTEPGAKNAPQSIATASIPPFSLRVFRLGPREVDGSPPGEFNTGTHTALTRHAYRIHSTFPVVAYQFNPLENVNVFSNDASLLKPTEALTPVGDDLTPAYVALGWPQTLANSSDPDTNFSPQNPVSLRAFLTLVGTVANTHVRVQSTTRILGGGMVPETPLGGTLDFELGAFDVLNLETDGFNADFTGSIVSSNNALVVFSGGEASDAPFFDKLINRKCCADHLEEQLDPIRTAGQSFVATVSPSRTEALSRAGAAVGAADQLEYFRVIATSTAQTHVTTSLSGEFQDFDLRGRGSFVTIPSRSHFSLESDAPVMLSSVSPSQQDANVPSGLPGGDPSLLIMPPIEQFRSSYVFLTPDKYSFDFVRVVAPRGATVVFDGRSVDAIDGCVASDADGITDEARRKAVGPSPFLVYTCQLSFPIIDPNKPIDLSQSSQAILSAGVQNDGVHRVEASAKVGVLVDGFDSYVSYAYAAGTELELIVPK